MKIVIWSKPNCSYCSGTKHMLQVYNIPFEEKMLGVDFTREILLENYPSAKTFPVVVVDGFYIGGYEQLTEMVKTQIAATTQQRLLNEANNSGCSV